MIKYCCQEMDEKISRNEIKNKQVVFEQEEKIKKAINKFYENQEDIEPEIADILNEHFWDFL